MLWWILFSYWFPFFVSICFIFPRSSREHLRHLTSCCPNALCFCSSREALRRLFPFPYNSRSFRFRCDCFPLTRLSLRSRLRWTQRQVLWYRRSISFSFDYSLSYCIKKRKSYADFLSETQNCPSHSERTASHNAEKCLLHFTHKCTHTHGRIGGHGVFSFRFQWDYCITVFAICLISYRYSWL